MPHGSEATEPRGVALMRWLLGEAPLVCVPYCEAHVHEPPTPMGDAYSANRLP
ncbi:hypothetical protein BMG523Draft_00711 [Frankia sp. BMG5.23]|nr:hypothetical protein BMG523Draft_00711 [Frankia sp. BMG5.23]